MMFGKKLKKVLATVCAVSLCTGIGGCGKKNTNGELGKLTTDGKYPMDTDVTLRVWMNFTPDTTLSSMNDTEFKKYLEEATGVKIEFEHPAVGSSAEAFNLMLASDDMPDIIIYSWRSADVDKHIDSGAITDLTPYINAGVMPNLKKIIDDNKGYEEMCLSPNGKYYYAPMILGDDILLKYRVCGFCRHIYQYGIIGTVCLCIVKKEFDA